MDLHYLLVLFALFLAAVAQDFDFVPDTGGHQPLQNPATDPDVKEIVGFAAQDYDFMEDTGGYLPLENPATDPDVKEIVDFAISEINFQSLKNLVLKGIVRAELQMVEGLNYHLVIEVMDPEHPNTIKEYEFTVFTRYWDNIQPSLLVFSGGTAFNGVVEDLKTFTTRSTAEIVLVLGGPAVGDIRSRCLRLADKSTSEAVAVRQLLGRRLPFDARQAKSEWYDIVEGEHNLWTGVSKPYRETIRAFLVYFQNQILRRSDDSFCFSNGSIGNFFFAGARVFFQSLDAAIFLFSRVSDIPSESLVLPVISTNDRLTLGCELSDGTIIRGQNEISHPTKGYMALVNKGSSSAPALSSRIKRVFYMSSEGQNLLHEVFPAPNPAVMDQLRNVDCIVYAMGSLFTSVCPSLVLIGIGEITSSRSCPKVLLLNGTHDRETSGFSASCFVTAITDALNRTYGAPHNCLKNLPSHYINTLLVPKDGEIPVNVQCLADEGIFEVIVVDSVHDPKVGVVFDPKSLIQALDDLIGRHMPTNVKVV